MTTLQRWIEEALEGLYALAKKVDPSMHYVNPQIARLPTEFTDNPIVGIRGLLSRIESNLRQHSRSKYSQEACSMDSGMMLERVERLREY